MSDLKKCAIVIARPHENDKDVAFNQEKRDNVERFGDEMAQKLTDFAAQNECESEFEITQTLPYVGLILVNASDKLIKKIENSDISGIKWVVSDPMVPPMENPAARQARQQAPKP